METVKNAALILAGGIAGLVVIFLGVDREIVRSGPLPIGTRITIYGQRPLTILILLGVASAIVAFVAWRKERAAR